MAKKENKKTKLAIIDSEDSATMSLKKRVEALSLGDFNLVQDLLQEIQSIDMIEEASTGKKFDLKSQVNRLDQEIKDKYKDKPEIKDLLLEYLPGYDTIRNWVKKDNWKEEVVRKAKSHTSVSGLRRITILDDLYKKAHERGDTRAMELFLRISGDLDTGKERKESKQEKNYRELGEALSKRK